MSRKTTKSEAFAVIVSQFGEEVTPKLRARQGYPEAQLRGPFERLLIDAGTLLGLKVLAIDETPLDIPGVRPDYMVNVAGAGVGYAELKARGKGVPTTWRTGRRDHDWNQWDQLRLLPNVLYSDGEQWAVYHFGELWGAVAKLDGDLRTAGRRLRPADGAFERVVEEFLLWKPKPPRTIDQLVKAVASLCHLLRQEVEEILAREGSGVDEDCVFSKLAEDWRKYLFPGLPNSAFADAYAQTVTFALLLARVDGISFESTELAEIARQLGKKHSLMGKALAVLTEGAAKERSIAVGTLLRVVGAVDWDILGGADPDVYLHLYEHFLEEYDPQLRKLSGSYYTPPDIVSFMVRFTGEILKDRMHVGWGFASDDVRIIDPAMGTGTYLLSVIEQVAKTIKAEEGGKAVPPQLRALFERMVGFEKQISPYAVAELRIHQILKSKYETEVPEKEVRFFVADTLDDPYIEVDYIPATLEPIARSRREANKIKLEMPIQVVIGNPPYDGKGMGLGGWIEKGNPSVGRRPPLRDFRAEGLGRLEKPLHSMYVYFWRWATWKAFDVHGDSPVGIVALITPSSFTTGPGYSGMREYLRRTADEGWIIDLSPEKGFPAPVGSRVFRGVREKLCITILARYGPPDPGTPAKLHYLEAGGSAEEKFGRLKTLGIGDAEWTDCGNGWQDQFAPALRPGWRQYPAVSDLMPWTPDGLKPSRSWVYSPDAQTLRRRWQRLIAGTPAEKPGLLSTTKSSRRTVTSRPDPLPGCPAPVKPLSEEKSREVMIERVALRSFDRQHIVYDARVIEGNRYELWQARGDRQVYATEQHAHEIAAGPALTFTSLVPDAHHFNGRGGHVLPLHRDPGGVDPNLAPGLTELLTSRLGTVVSPKDVIAYAAAVAAHPAYTARFTEDLKKSGRTRIPLTADRALWEEAASVGRRVIWLHTYGERFADPADGRPRGAPMLPKGIRPENTETIPDSPDDMPREVSYDPITETLIVGAGRIIRVPQPVWNYEVSGLKIIRSWFDYRKQEPVVRRSSHLNDIMPDFWPPRFTTELLELLNVLILCVRIEPRQSELLDRICSGLLITTDDLTAAGVLPAPESATKKPPRLRRPGATALPGFEGPSAW